jgi:tetratricopeptide (TPR) repeat protein
VAPAPVSRLDALLADLLLFQQAGDEDSQARCCHRIARVLLERGQPRAALQAVRLGLGAASEAAWLRAPLHALVGELLLRRRHLGLARHFLAAAAACYREAGLPVPGRATELAEVLLRGADDPEAARHKAQDGLAAAQAAGDRLGFAAALVVLGEIDASEQHFEGCRLCGQAALDALELRAALDQPLDPAERRLIADASSLLGRARAAQGEPELAVAPLKRAVSLREAGRPALLARDLEWLGYTRARLGQLVEARAAYTQALQLREQADLTDSAARVALGLAATCGQNPAEATRFLITAVELLARSPRPPRELVERTTEQLQALPKSHLLTQLAGRLAKL